MRSYIWDMGDVTVQVKQIVKNYRKNKPELFTEVR